MELCTKLFYAIIPTLFLCFLLICYPYISLQLLLIHCQLHHKVINNCWAGRVWPQEGRGRRKSVAAGRAWLQEGCENPLSSLIAEMVIQKMDLISSQPLNILTKNIQDCEYHKVVCTQMTTKPLTVETSNTVYCQVDSSQVGGGGGAPWNTVYRSMFTRIASENQITRQTGRKRNWYTQVWWEWVLCWYCCWCFVIAMP